MSALSKTLLGTTMGAGILALSVASAPAAIVCSGHACWHAHESYEYPKESRVIVHPDDWRWSRKEHFSWHEHEGRGYWRGSHWMEW
jgi:hypothetical protein